MNLKENKLTVSITTRIQIETLRTLLIFMTAFLYACQTDSTPRKQFKHKHKQKTTVVESTAPYTKLDTATNTSHLPLPTTLMQLNESAYGKTLAVEDNTVYLLTQSAAYRFSPTHKPVKTPIDLGYTPAMTSTSIVYWSKGKLYSTPKRGGKPQTLGIVEHQPRQIVASEKHVAWLDKDPKEKFTLQVIKAAKPQIIYQTYSVIKFPVMIKNWIYFIEQAPDTTWRIGGIPVDGDKNPRFTKPHTGRTPSMLSASDEIFYYDLPSRSVHRVSLDLSTDSVVAQKIVCSPIAVSSRLLCARVEGVFELPKKGGVPRVLTEKPMGLVTNIAGSSKLVAWINDTGKDELTLRVLKLSQ